MFKHLRSLAVLIASLLFVSPVFAFGYEHGNNTHFFLGGGVSPLKLNESLAACIKHAGTRQLDGPGVSNTSVVIKAVRNRKELYSTLGASLTISAHSFIGGGKLAADYLEQSEFFDDSLTWVVMAKSDFGRIALNTPELLPKFQKLIDDGKHSEFASTCGTHYFSQETRSASIFAIYTLRNLSQSQKSRLETLIHAGSSVGPLFSGSIESEFKRVLTQAMRSSQMSCHVYAVGGRGVNHLSGLVQSYMEDIGKVGQIIANYVGTLSAENAAPISYQTTSMREFGYREPSPLDYEKRDDVLARHYLLLREGQDISARLFSLILRDTAAAAKLSAAQIAEYKRTHEMLARDLHALHASAVQCYDDPHACSYPATTLPYVAWPPNDAAEQIIDLSALPSRVAQKNLGNRCAPKITLRREKIVEQFEQVLASGCINKREAQELENLRAIPFCVRSLFVGWCPLS